jgi:hypothetical protein
MTLLLEVVIGMTADAVQGGIIQGARGRATGG